MATVDQYLMERNAEILLARSAAPDSISSDATILILGRQGYEQLSEERTGLSVWWKEAGWRHGHPEVVLLASDRRIRTAKR